MSIALELGTSPVPKYGIDRDQEAKRIVQWFWDNSTRSGVDELIHKTLNSFTPLKVGFYSCFTDLFLDWLYANPR